MKCLHIRAAADSITQWYVAVLAVALGEYDMDSKTVSRCHLMIGVYLPTGAARLQPQGLPPNAVRRPVDKLLDNRATLPFTGRLAG